MSLTESTNRQNASLMRDLLSAGRHYLGNRRALLILAAVLIIAGLVFNWNWLVAAGIAPILLSTLPCLLMCAFGVCMMCKATKDQPTATRDSADAGMSTSAGVASTPRVASDATSCCNHGPEEAQVIELKQSQSNDPRRESRE